MTMQRPFVRVAAVSAIAVLLSACGGGDTDQAVEACAKAIQDKLGAERNYRIDRDDMAAKAVAEDGDIVHVQSSVVFDPGLPREYTQTMDCRARLSDDTPTVISLTFTW